MFAFYDTLGRRLHGYRAVLWILVAVAVVVFLGVVFFAPPSDDQTYALSAILLLLWSLSLVVVVQTFAAPAPDVDPSAGFIQRARTRFVRAFRWLMAITTTALFAFVILLSFKAVGLLLRG